MIRQVECLGCRQLLVRCRAVCKVDSIKDDIECVVALFRRMRGALSQEKRGGVFCRVRRHILLCQLVRDCLVLTRGGTGD